MIFAFILYFGKNREQKWTYSEDGLIEWSWANNTLNRAAIYPLD